MRWTPPGAGFDAIDLFVYHQANSRIIGAVGERLGCHPVASLTAWRTTGNTSAASVPIALAEAQLQGGFGR